MRVWLLLLSCFLCGLGWFTFCVTVLGWFALANALKQNAGIMIPILMTSIGFAIPGGMVIYYNHFKSKVDDLEKKG